MKVIDYSVLIDKFDISGIPVIEAKPISRAHWIPSSCSHDDGAYYCSRCGKKVYPHNWRKPLEDEYFYCQKCGSYMQEDGDKE